MTDKERKTVIYVCLAYDSAGYEYTTEVRMPYIKSLGDGPFFVREGRIVRK